MSKPGTHEWESDLLYYQLTTFQPMLPTDFAELVETDRNQAIAHLTELTFSIAPYSALKDNFIVMETGNRSDKPNYQKSDEELIADFSLMALHRVQLLATMTFARQCTALRESGKADEARAMITAVGGKPSF